MAELILQVGQILTGTLAWAGKVVEFMVGQPLLMLGIAGGLIGSAVGLVKKFI